VLHEKIKKFIYQDLFIKIFRKRIRHTALHMIKLLILMMEYNLLFVEPIRKSEKRYFKYISIFTHVCRNILTIIHGHGSASIIPFQNNYTSHLV